MTGRTSVEPEEKHSLGEVNFKGRLWERAVVFFDGGFLSKEILKLFRRHEKVDIHKLALWLAKETGYANPFRIYYYDCPWYVDKESDPEQQKHDREMQRNRDRFFRALESRGIIVKRGRLKKVVGKGDYSLEDLKRDLDAALIEAKVVDEETRNAVLRALHSKIKNQLEFRQKGVDSMLITDLVSLAALGRISTAIIVSNDGDFGPALRFVSGQGIRIVVAGPADTKYVNHKLQELADQYIPLTKDVLSQFLMSD